MTDSKGMLFNFWNYLKACLEKSTLKTENLLKKITDTEVQLSELLARYHLRVIGNNNPSNEVLNHTIQLFSHIFVKASIVLATSLTNREKEYIELASRGHKLKEIAKFLNISVSFTKIFGIFFNKNYFVEI